MLGGQNWIRFPLVVSKSGSENYLLKEEQEGKIIKESKRNYTPQPEPKRRSPHQPLSGADVQWVNRRTFS